MNDLMSFGEYSDTDQQFVGFRNTFPLKPVEQIDSALYLAILSEI